MAQAILSTSSLAAGVQAAPPTFAKDFYTGLQSSLALVSDGYYIQDGGCCSRTLSAGCKVQAMSSGADYRESGSLNRTRSDGAQGAIVNWYGSVRKQMAVAPGAQTNSTHKWSCVGYCPLDQDAKFYPSLTIDPKAKDEGSQPVTQPKSIGGTTKQCEKFSYVDGIGPIPMESTNTFVDMSTTPPAPFFVQGVIEPFGNKAAEENSSYISYTPMDVSDYFDIDLEAKNPKGEKYCQKSDQCQPPPAPPSKRDNTMLEQHMQMFGQSVLAKAEKEAAALGNVHADPPPPPNVTFVGDFTSTEDSIMVINQGGHVESNGDICCHGDVPQCQIQMSHRNGMRYLDVTNQRTRFDDSITGQNVVDDYTLHMSMLLNVTAGVETCQEYCPIEKGDKLYPIDPFDPFDTVKDLGADTFDGKPAHHYRWSDVILKFIKMQTTDFYANIDDTTAAVPIASLTDISPFGQEMGKQNQTWTNFKAGPPDATKFKIAGTATCPQSSKCQQSAQMAHRFASRQFHTFYKDILSVPEQSTGFVAGKAHILAA